MLSLQSIDSTVDFELDIHYWLYTNFTIVRKAVTIRDTSKATLKLEGLDIEDLNTSLDYIKSVVHHNYGRMKNLGEFVGNWVDPVVVVHNITERRGYCGWK